MSATRWQQLDEAREHAQVEADRVCRPMTLIWCEGLRYLEAYIPAHERGTNVVIVRPMTGEQKEESR